MTKKLKKLWCENCAVTAPANIAENIFKTPRMNSVGFFFFRILPVLLFLLTLTGSWTSAYAESMSTETVTEEPFGERKNITGEISAVNKEGLALITKTDEAKGTESEMWLPFAGGMRFNGYNEAGDITAGDQVSAIYEEGGGKRLLREVTFNQRAPEVPLVPENIAAPEPEAVQEGAPQ